MNTQELISTLQHTDLFATFPDRDLHRIAARAEMVELPARTVLFREGMLTV